MNKIRFAQKNDLARQKEIWQLCFGDSPDFIDLYYSSRYDAKNTLVFLENNLVCAMLTFMPAKLAIANQAAIEVNIIYAVATHPAFQGRGLAAQLLEYAGKYLGQNNIAFSILVPAGTGLIDYYRRQGYETAFLIRETALNHEQIQTASRGSCLKGEFGPVAPEQYNAYRNCQLSSSTYLMYSNEDIAYQKLLSQHSGADLYVFRQDETYGVAAIERLSAEKIIIKELLVADLYFDTFLQHIIQLHSAKEYILRTPVPSAQNLQDSIRPFAMIKKHRNIMTDIKIFKTGYLGLAFD